MTRYCLKAMVLARLFAEASVLIAFISAPVFLLCTGKMLKLDVPVQGLFYCLAVIGLAILPWFGFLTWQVRVDEKGLVADALFRHQFCAWETMKKITRRASWNWQRYVIEFEGGSLHFPVLLARSSELIQTIREHLPSGGEVGLSDESPNRTFTYDPISRISEVVQSVVACVFVSIFWYFFAFNWHKHFQSTQDAAIVLIFCLLMTVIFIWRLFIVVTMPESIELTQQVIIFRSLFKSRSILWTELKSLDKPLPVLPEGVIVKTTRGNIFVGSGLDASDEMQEIMLEELAQVRQDLAFIAAAKMRAATAPPTGLDALPVLSSSSPEQATDNLTLSTSPKHTTENPMSVTSPEHATESSTSPSTSTTQSDAAPETSRDESQTIS
jgi:hypothetical protein